MQESPDFLEVIREWILLIGGVITLVALIVGRRPMFRSFWPIRIVPLGNAKIVSDPILGSMYLCVRVGVETLKRTEGPITRLTAYIEGDESNILDLLEPYHQPSNHVDEQDFYFGHLANTEYSGRRLVIVAEARMRKGRLALKRKVLIS